MRKLHIFISLAVLVLAFVSINFSTDRDNYLSVIPYFTDFGQVFSFSLEPFFILVSVIINKLGLHPYFLFLTFIFISVFLKVSFILKNIQDTFAPFVIYFFYFLILHDLVQLRVSIAIGIFLWALVYLAEKDYWKYNLLIFGAMVFHFSAVIFFLFNFINQDKVSKKGYTLFLLGCLTIAFLKIDIFVTIIDVLLSISNGPFLVRLKLYYELKDLGEHADIRIFNILSIIWLAVLIFIFVKLDFTKFSRLENLSFKAFALSNGVFFLFHSFPVLAFRVSEMLAMPVIVLSPYILNKFKQEYIIRPVVSFVFIFLGLYMIFVQKLLLI